MAIYRAIDKKKPPKRPQELAQEDEKANQMWDLLLKCWDHDPTARPDAPFIMGYVRMILWIDLAKSDCELLLPGSSSCAMTNFAYIFLEDSGEASYMLSACYLVVEIPWSIFVDVI